ncbi:MAG: VanW family protein [Bacteroidota bacterium]
MFRGRPLLLFLPAAALTLLVLAGFFVFRLDGRRIMGRVYIDGLFMGGWDRQTAAKVLAQRTEAYLSSPVTLFYNERSWHLCPLEAGITIDWTRPLAEALAPGQAGKRLFGFVSAFWRPRRLGLRVCMAQAQLIAFLREKIAPGIEREPRNARYDPATGALVAARPGMEIDYGATGRNLCRAVLRPSERRASLVVKSIAPATGDQDLAGLKIQHVLASFRTSVASSTRDRLANIARSASRLNGALLSPGEAFSFNGFVGPRDAAHGYRPAPEIVRRDYVPGIGGGICQVASTLYNAVLLAGLPVFERHCHALPPDYVPLGRDATVYYPNLDLRFGNSTGGYLMILAQVDGDTLRVVLLGEEASPERVSIVTRVLAKLTPPLVNPDDPRATSNLAGAPGYHVRVTRFFGNPEDPARVETVSEDIYHPVPRVLGAKNPVPESNAAPFPREAGRKRKERAAPPREEVERPDVATSGESRRPNIALE